MALGLLAASGELPAPALTAPDISCWRHGNTGIDYVHRLDSGIPGPQAMIAGIVHGNELCGAIVLDRLLREGFRPQLGSLTLVFANPRAYATFDPANPTASRYVDEDLNRVWSPLVLDGARCSAELERARELRPRVDTVEILPDLHSMQQDSRALTLCGIARKGRDLARALGLPPLIVADEGHASGRRLRDYDGFGTAGDPRRALLVECGQHWKTETADLANRVADRFLAHLGMAEPANHPPGNTAPDDGREPVCIEVTRAVAVRSDKARFAEPFTGLETIAHAGTPILYDGDDVVRTPYDQCVLVMPARRLHRGQTAVRLGRIVPCDDGPGDTGLGDTQNDY
ncbi:MAG: succinylglutamate desuccinylase/aspartoacylase family protein [Alphaproteobacteria bacterium]